MNQTAASEANELQFDNASRSSHSDQPVPLGGVPRALREAAEMSGLDPVSELYNEALRYASEGHLRLARERLQMLLCMKPDDGESRLMLAKIFVAGQRWQDAIAALDEAASCGQAVPPSLRQAVEHHLQSQTADDNEERTAIRAREQGEIKALRQEARRLRSENAQLVGRGADLEREIKFWSIGTATVAVVAALFIGTQLMFGTSGTEVAAEVVAPTENVVIAEDGAPTVVTAPGEAPTEGAAPDAAPNTTAVLAERAANALSAAPGLQDTNLEVEVGGSSATVTGMVLTARQRNTAKNVLSGVNGISSVDVDKVRIIARTRGATHEVVSGDTLGGIASQYYGESSLSKEIYKSNRKTLRSPTSLSIGQILKIPAVD